MDLIAKKYRVLKTLGKGAMGEVHLVLPPRGDPVALKLLRAAESNQQTAIEQFENEFKVLKKLSHPNIGRIYDYGYDEELHKVYFTSPWLQGSDLFQASRDLSFEKCEDFFIQLLRAVNYLHQKGIIHCDLKPGNIFVENDQVLLIDFGLAGYWGESIVGTPTYLAPEIFRGEHHSEASDLYAIGVVFYNCLTRTQPFSGKSLQEVYDRHRTFTPPPISKLNPNAPKYFSDIASTLLSKKAEERYQSASAVIEEIAAFSSKKYSVETPETLLSYLPATTELIGRKEIQWRIETIVDAFLKDYEKTPYLGVFIYGENGVGKTQFASQIKTRLQLEKVSIEEVSLPLSESDQKMLSAAEAFIMPDMENYIGEPGKNLDLVGQEGQQNLNVFLSFLEQKVLAPETRRLFLVVTGTDKEHWKPFEKLFPQEEFIFEEINLPPFNQEETRLFLETIVGQKQIPERFVSEVFRNTGGNPGICKQIVENLINQGLLFDESGRWSLDLISHLEDTLKLVETPKSLEEKMELEYSSLSRNEKEIVDWLALAPHGLTAQSISFVTEIEEIQELLVNLISTKVIRQENKNYYLYRSAFGPFLLQKISAGEQKRRHACFAQRGSGISQIDVWYHQSLGADLVQIQTSLEKLGDAMARMGEREKALECYEKLNKTFVAVPLPQRVEWAIKASEILIWLDHFQEAEKILTRVENEVEQAEGQIPLKSRLLLWEKKGVALLHQQKIQEARFYFSEGVKLSASDDQTQVEEIRFLNDLAQIEVIMGHSEKAIEKFLASRDKAKNLSHKDLQRITNNDLGHVYYQQKKYQKAVSLLEEDSKIFEKLPYKEPLARALYSLAESYRALKKLEKAIVVYERCIEICQKDKILPILLRAYNGLGNVHIVKERYKEALASYQQAIEISVHLKDPTTKAALLANQALIYCNQKNWSQAQRRFLLAKQILESKESKLAYENMLLAKCYHELTAIAKEENDPMKALSFQIEQMRIAEKYETLDSRKFTVKFDLAELYLENRLADPLASEIQLLEGLAKSNEEKEKLDSLKKRWKGIQTFDQEKTMKMS